MLNLETVFYGLLGTGAGIYWFFAGFRELKASRTVRNIPTSRIATGAVGSHVEIKGTIVRQDGRMLFGPISGRPCVFYSIEIQKLVKSRNSSFWKQVDQYFSDPEFLVDDGSGAMARIFPEGAEIRRKGREKIFQVRSNNFSNMPPGLKEDLIRHASKLKSFKIRETSWLFSSEYRFLEWSFLPEETIYILGYAHSGVRAPAKQKLKIENYFKARKKIESSSELQSRYDTNGDGRLDEFELERGAKYLGWEFQRKDTPVSEMTVSPKVKMVFGKTRSVPFLISNMKEDELIRKLSNKAILMVWGGPVVAIGSIAYLSLIFSQYLR